MDEINYYTSIDFSNESELSLYSTDINSEGKAINNINKINIFIGPNNSGKSRFMRQLFASENLNYKYEIFNKIKFDEVLQEFIHKIKSKYPTDLYDYDQNSYLKDIISFNLNHSNDIEIKTKFNQLYNSCSFLLRNNTSMFRKISNQHFTNISFQSEILELYKIVNQINNYTNNFFRKENVYIPTLRGLRDINNSDDVYKIVTQNDYFKSSKYIQSHNIFTGLDLYEKLTKS